MAKAVEPMANISAPDLLNTVPRLFGWVRKEDNTGLRAVVKPLLDWPWHYMILRTGCLYLYRNPQSSNYSEAIPLTKYSVCDAQDITKYKWVFKLIHSTEVKTLFFAVDTEFDLKDFIHPDDDSQTAYDLTLLLRSNYFSPTIIPDHGSFYYWELKKWKDAVTEEKENFCQCSTLKEDDKAPNYCEIDETPYNEKPLPPLPSSAMRQRPPAPLPEPAASRRPHSLSFPPHYNQPGNSPLIPHKQHSPCSSTIPEHPTKKPATLPRPLPVALEKPKPKSPKEQLHRSSSESSLGLKLGNGYDNVVEQLERKRMSFIHEEDNETLPQLHARAGGSTPLRPNTRGRGPPDGCETSKGKHVEQSSPARSPFPQLAYQEHMTKESASRALKSHRMGTYLTRPSQGTESQRSLSVLDQNDQGMPLVRHYRIFYNKGLGYALDTKGPWFESIPETLEHYYHHQLPNTKGKLCYPYL